MQSRQSYRGKRYEAAESRMKNIFSSQGYLSGIIPRYEHRPEQLQMAEFILERFVEKENGIVEAGTGTGKTLAYIIPSLIYAKENDLKVAVTTETKALQKQLMDKDIPLAEEIFKKHLGIDISYALCLGSSNYPCRRRFEFALKKGTLGKDDIRKLGNILRLFGEDVIFTRFDVRVSGKLWSEICRESDACASYHCNFAPSCPYQKARKEWQSADLLVMNHYLFFTHIASGKTLLPKTDIVVFDEAHSVEDIASSQLGFNLSQTLLSEILDRFHHGKKRHSLLSRIQEMELREKSIGLLGSIAREAGYFFEKVRTLFPRDSLQFRCLKPLNFGVELVGQMKEFMLLMSEAEEEFGDEYARMEFDIARGRFFLFVEALVDFIYHNNDPYVYWIERNESSLMGDVALRGQPIQIADIMRREVINAYSSSVFVSATLAVNGEFGYISGRLGLERCTGVVLSSPFDYQKQALLYVKKDISEPGTPLFSRQAAQAVAEIIQIVKGNCLVLFTSYKMLEEVRGFLADLVENRIYSQGDLSSSEAVEMYMSDEDSILMGTHSYWQGIDLPGDLVRCVIMMRLPFSVPDAPPVQARVELLKTQGLNPFVVYQIPEAVIKFKQGFGRLIRSRQDRGIVAVLDSRIVSKPYGRQFISALPKCSVVFTSDQVAAGYAGLFE